MGISFGGLHRLLPALSGFFSCTYCNSFLFHACAHLGPPLFWRTGSTRLDSTFGNHHARIEPRIRHAVSLHPLHSSSYQYFCFASKVTSNQSVWVATAIVWTPLNDWVHNFPSTPSTNRGRLPKRCDQALTSFLNTYSGERNWLKAAQRYDQWSAAKSTLRNYVITKRSPYSKKNR